MTTWEQQVFTWLELPLQVPELIMSRWPWSFQNMPLKSLSPGLCWNPLEMNATSLRCPAQATQRVSTHVVWPPKVWGGGRAFTNLLCQWWSDGKIHVPKKEGQHSASINYKLTVTFALCYQDVSLHPGKSRRGPLLREDSGNLVNRILKIRHSNIFKAVYKDNKRKSKRQNEALCFHFQKVT